MHPDKICHMCGVRSSLVHRTLDMCHHPYCVPCLGAMRQRVRGRVLNPPQQFMGYAVEFRLRKMRCRV